MRIVQYTQKTKLLFFCEYTETTTDFSLRLLSNDLSMWLRVNRAGPRVLTFFVYLSDVPEGGEL